MRLFLVLSRRHCPCYCGMRCNTPFVRLIHSLGKGSNYFSQSLQAHFPLSPTSKQKLQLVRIEESKKLNKLNVCCHCSIQHCLMEIVRHLHRAVRYMMVSDDILSVPSVRLSSDVWFHHSNSYRCHCSSSYVVVLELGSVHWNLQGLYFISVEV